MSEVVNKAELIDRIAQRTALKKQDINAVIDVLFDVTCDVLKERGRIALTGLISVEPVERAARECYNIKTGQKMLVAASTGVKIKPGSKLKSAVRQD